MRDRRDVDFNFLGHLDELRRKVAGEVRQINELFPEYTPHDEVYHLARLFHVADTILGPDRIEAMNETELFLLSCALYGHDWGMAVNEVERRFILGGDIPNESDSARIRILPDERSRLQRFLEQQGLKTLNHSTGVDLDAAMWREYVRQTHAFRSGERCRQFFEPIDGGVAEALARICVGHWLDIEELRRHEAYPRDLSILRRTINLPALTVYLRLIDLFDLGEDRTPYVIWKFVAPRDPRARLEWEKHRALQPITCPAYQTGRIIRVDGITDDHEVFAALEDLRRYCESQFDGCLDILKHLNDERHTLARIMHEGR